MFAKASFGLAGVLLSLVFFGSPVCADPIVLSDPYGGPSNNGSSNGDVIGLLKNFDIDSLTFTSFGADSITIEIRFNYHSGDATLSNWIFPGGSHPTLGVGDLLFDVGGDYQYGVALVSHDAFDAGDLYSITGTTSSNDYLSGSGLTWGFNLPVGMSPTGAVLLGAGTSVTTSLTGYEVLTTLTFDPNAAFLQDLSDGLSVHFASAWCANDTLDGRVERDVPEPQIALGLAAALGAVAAYRQRRSK